MDKPIPEAVSVTLHQDRAGCEWIIVTSKDHPDSESEVTPSDDPALFDLLKPLTAAQQQGDGEVIQRHVVTKYRDGSVHVADVAAPPSATEALRVQVGQEWIDLDPTAALTDAIATQNQEPPMTAETDLLPCRCGNTNLHVARFLGACRVVCRRCEEQTSYSRNHVDMWNRKMKREKDRD